MLQKNDTFELNIVDLGVGGEGIGKYEGMTFFVKDAIPGDIILAGVTKLKKKYGYARIVEIIKPSEDRVEPPCKVANKCGGCQIQGMSYDAQLRMKSELVKNDLVRLGGFDKAFIENIMEPIVGMDEPYHYRNKAQFPVGLDANGQIVMGYYASHSHRIIETDECLLGRPVNEVVLKAVKSYMIENNVSPYNEGTGKGLIRHILIRYGFTSKEVMVCIIANATKLPNENDLVERLIPIDGIKSISLNTNTARNNVILGDKLRTLWGEDYIVDSIGDVEFAIGPKSFYQVNPVQTEKLYNIALEYAELTGKENVWDLYCGIGTISLFLAEKAHMVYGVEIVPEAIDDANKNAKRNGIENAKFFVGKAEEVLPDFYEGAKNSSDEADKSMLTPDVIVVDPPRKGCDEACLNTMIEMRPKRIVYVSCDPATLSRDLKILCDNGYELKLVRTVDQFCHSMHIESVAQLKLK